MGVPQSISPAAPPARRIFETLLISAVLLGSWLVITTEVLSLYDALFFWPVLMTWTGSLLGTLAFFRNRSFVRPFKAFRLITAFSRRDRVLAGLVAVLVVSAGLSAVAYPPHTWDGLFHHMARQVRWLQNHSLDHFPTHVLPQLYSEPFAEIVSLNLVILFQTDRLSNLVQWAAYVMVIPAVILSSGIIGAGPTGQLLAGLLAAAIPVAFLEASTTKNDLVFSLWYCVLLWLGLKVLAQRRCGWNTAALIGLAFGLMMYTKGLAYLYGLGLVGLIAAGIIRAEQRRFWKPGLIITVLALALNSGHYARNAELFGSLRPSLSDHPTIRSSGYNPLDIASRCLRELAYHLGSPIPTLNLAIEKSVVSIHEILGLDVNDPRTTLRPFQVAHSPGNEYQASAPAHLLVAGAVFVLSLLYRRRIRNWTYWALFPIPYVSFVLYCLVCKFDFAQGPRYNLPVILTQTVLFGALAAYLDFRSFTIRAYAAIALAALIPSFVLNPRSLVWPPTLRLSEYQSMFQWAPQLQSEMAEAAAYIKLLNPSVVSIDARINETHPGHPQLDPFEYLIMRLLAKENGFRRPVFQAFNVDNISAGLRRDRQPADVVVLFQSQPGEQTDSLSGIRYVPVRHWAHISVLVPARPSHGRGALSDAMGK